MTHIPYIPVLAIMSSQVSPDAEVVNENPKKGQIGLANLGNTCYLNAILQALRHVPDLSVFFHKHSDSWIHEGDDKNALLCKAYKELVTGLWSGTAPGYMRPAGFLHHFRAALRGTMVEHMIAPHPHDSHEALVFLLDQLHEGMKKPLEMEITLEESAPAYKALLTWKKDVAPHYSPIVDYFFGLMEVSVTCTECKNVSCRYEPFNMLKVGFPDPKMATMEQCIDYEFQGEPIGEYDCDACKAKQKDDCEACKANQKDECDACKANKKPRGPAVIQRRIWQLPKNLIIVLKRFNPNGSKCHANFTAEHQQTFTKWFAAASPEASRTANYTLQSIVDHHGHAGGGHYTAQVKSPLTSQWNMYDDENVSMIKDGKSAHFGQMNYMLFYRVLKN